jgi:hypothetical protein
METKQAMPGQTEFFRQQVGDKRIVVLKTYDQNYAYEAFAEMDETARKFLWSSLRMDEEYEADEIPPMESAEAENFLWNALLEDSREDGNTRSFFVVTEAQGKDARPLYVSSDWPSSERFAKSVLGAPSA